uniref:uncharacterized protein LOC120327103 n=1 Tax=Styela clava TaxID=7725 RepID=UPI001939EE48|nr:uncharacterized protein LOC120327103 [Styela clava]
MKDIDDIAANAVTKIQACWRGYQCRKKLQEIYDWYKSVVLEIDGVETEYQQVRNNKLNILKRPSAVSKSVDQNEENKTNSTRSSIPEILEVDVTSDTYSTKCKSPNEIDQQHLSDRKRDIVMELFWVQQAIDSRRNYLLLKNKIDS